MKNFTRRSFLKTSGLVMGTTILNPWFGNIASAQVSRNFIRHNAASADGKKMLAIYARGVAIMMDKLKYPEADPRSWLFQWYTHAVRSDRDRASEIQRIYSGAEPQRQIALDMWNTCEAHFDSSREEFFLPWHRMYLRYFEQIIRAVTNDNSFTLPYWDYTDPKLRKLPEEFRKDGDPIWKSLFRSSRISQVNNGDRIDQHPGASAISLNALKSPSYSETQGDAGFCSNIDNDPHGSIHVSVGNRMGMGTVPWAANDPIFWLHHCNIDRIWASWNKAGGLNPETSSFKNETFVFVDGAGKTTKSKVSDFLDTDGYSYDEYLQRPADSSPFHKDGMVPFSIHAISFESPGPLKLTSAPLSIKLGPPVTNGGNIQPFSAGIKRIPPTGTLYLRLENVRALREPEVSYDLYLNLGPQLKHDRKDPSFIASVNFFGLGITHGSTPNLLSDSKKNSKTFSFVIGHATRQRLSNNSENEPQVTLIPNGTPVKDANPEIGKVTLVSA